MNDEKLIMISNLHHMTHSHGFFVPDLEYLSDLEGLISYLADKISVGFTCLYCNGKGKSFWSLEAVQTHMVSSFLFTSVLITL